MTTTAWLKRETSGLTVILLLSLLRRTRSLRPLRQPDNNLDKGPDALA